MKLKKIGILSLGYAAAIFAFLSALFQVLGMTIASKIPLASNLIDPTLASFLQGKTLAIMLVITPIVAIIAGFIGGVLMAAIYNWIVVPISGGIKLELEDHKKR